MGSAGVCPPVTGRCHPASCPPGPAFPSFVGVLAATGHACLSAPPSPTLGWLRSFGRGDPSMGTPRNICNEPPSPATSSRARARAQREEGHSSALPPPPPPPALPARGLRGPGASFSLQSLPAPVSTGDRVTSGRSRPSAEPRRLIPPNRVTVQTSPSPGDPPPTWLLTWRRLLGNALSGCSRPRSCLRSQPRSTPTRGSQPQVFAEHLVWAGTGPLQGGAWGAARQRWPGATSEG